MKEYLTDPCSRAVLQTPVLLIKSVSQSVSQSVIIFLQCLKHHFIQTIKARALKFLENVHPQPIVIHIGFS